MTIVGLTAHHRMAHHRTHVSTDGAFLSCGTPGLHRSNISPTYDFKPKIKYRRPAIAKDIHLHNHVDNTIKPEAEATICPGGEGTAAIGNLEASNQPATEAQYYHQLGRNSEEGPYFQLSG